MDTSPSASVTKRFIQPKSIKDEMTYGYLFAGAWQVDSTFGLNQYGLPLYALVVVSGDYKPFSAPGLLMFCSSDPDTTHEIEAIETLIRVALHLIRLKPGRCRVMLNSCFCRLTIETFRGNAY